jgi:multiple sugar transport system ATP-binding protein
MAELKLRNINKTYDNGFEAVKNFNMDIKDKEFIVLVGPSGCGKTTTLRMIAGLEDITSGELYIGDRLVNDVSPKDRDVAMVFQNYALYPHMNVYDNMSFALKLRKTPKKEIKEQIHNAAKILKIEDLLKRKPKQLSGGQRQRVALGRAIVRNPKLFLMDEPLSNLDAKLRVEMRTEISKLHKELETTFIYVTHDQVEAMTMGTRIVIMKDGFVQQIGTPQEAYDYPNNKFVASFIGSPQMNILDALVIKDKEEIVLKVEDIVFKLTKEKQIKLTDYIDKEITIGIRPENLAHKSQQNNDNYSEFSRKIDLIERMGSETYVYINIDSKQCTARFEAHIDVIRGQTATFTVGLDKIHAFDNTTEETIF